MNKLRVFESFAGYGSQAMALRNIGVDFEVVGISEIDKYALKAYELIHGHCPNYGDICKIDWDNVPDFDLFTYSFPCFLRGELVLTDHGYKEIQNIVVGDCVLTHSGCYKRVSKTFVNKYSDDLVVVSSMPSEPIKTTKEHPFYTRRRYREWDNTARRYVRKFTSPEWTRASDLTKDIFIGVPINNTELLPLNYNGNSNNQWGHNRIIDTLSDKFTTKEFWYLIGRYIADGWTVNNVEKHRYRTIICCNDDKLERLANAITDCGFHYTLSKDRTANKLIVPAKELSLFVDRYGKYAHGKRLDGSILNLPIELLSSFIDGYMDGDGCFTNNRYKLSSVSKELIYGMGACIAKAYRVPYSIYKVNRPEKVIIENRICNQKNTYNICFDKISHKQDVAFYEDGFLWFPIRKLSNEFYCGSTYNFEVEDDNSYTINNIAVHNCQDISIAGRANGLSKDSGTRSSLLWECSRAIEAKKPKYLLMENVKNLVSKKFIGDFLAWQNYLSNLGYTNFSQVLNAKDYGVPQNRERVFMVSILGDAWYNFPQKQRLTKCLKDVLEDEVNEKYYLSEKMLEGFLNHADRHKERGNGFSFVPNDINKPAHCVSTREGCVPTSNWIPITDPKIIQLGNLIEESNFANPHRGRIYSIEGLSPALNTCGGGGLEPKILQRSHGYNNGGEFDICPTITTSSFEQNNYVVTDRIRRITPREAFRLMGVSDSDFDKLKGISDTQLYKLAGNSIVVPVLEQLFTNLLKNN